jgi:nucleoside-specific channel-forming protein
MKKTLVILLGLLLATSMFADFTWGQLNFYEGIGVSNPYGGETYNLTYFEIEGGGRTGCLNFYYFFDINNVFGVRDELKESVAPGDYFLKVNPRFSLNTISGKNLAIGPVKEWYLATLYLGWASGGYSGDTYYAGIGTDLDIPLFNMFSLNFYKRMENTNSQNTAGDWEVKFEDAGWVVAINWFTVVKKFSEKFNLSYQGWSDFGLSNTYAEDNNMDWSTGIPVPCGTATEFQMFNGFFWNYDKWSLSTSVKFHNNFLYTDLETHDAISPWIGLHRRF